jgi:hypothetical protein
MKVGQCLSDLPGGLAEDCIREGAVGAGEVGKGSSAEVFHDDVDGVGSLEVVKDSDDARVLDAFHDLDFPCDVSSLFFSGKLKLGEGLYDDLMRVLPTRAKTHSSKATLAKHIPHRVPSDHGVRHTHGGQFSGQLRLLLEGRFFVYAKESLSKSVFALHL